MCNPARWAMAILEMDTLKPRSWLAGSVLDFYLLHRWYCCARPRVLYLPLSFSNSNSVPTQDEIDAFRNIATLDLNPALRDLPIAMLIHHSSHYFVVICDVSQRSMSVLGRQISRDTYSAAPPLHDWSGDHCWSVAAAFHGRPNHRRDRAEEVNWRQVRSLSSLLVWP
jgi:hypothetical protein